MSKLGDGPAFASVTNVRKEPQYLVDPEGEFPPTYTRTETIVETTGGMTLRQHYAGLAMQGILPLSPTPSDELVAKQAFVMADALISELEKEAP